MTRHPQPEDCQTANMVCFVKVQTVLLYEGVCQGLSPEGTKCLEGTNPDKPLNAIKCLYLN